MTKFDSSYTDFFKLNRLSESTLDEAIRDEEDWEDLSKSLGDIVTVKATSKQLGPQYPFKNGDKVKIVDFIGHQGNYEEYAVEKGGKIAYLTTELMK